MSEAAYPHPRSLPKGAKTRLRQAGEVEYIPSDVEDIRPTQQFKEVVQEILKIREDAEHKDQMIPLSKHLDNALIHRGIAR